MHQILAVTLPQTPLGELMTLPQELHFMELLVRGGGKGAEEKGMGGKLPRDAMHPRY